MKAYNRFLLVFKLILMNLNWWCMCLWQEPSADVNAAKQNTIVSCHFVLFYDVNRFLKAVAQAFCCSSNNVTKWFYSNTKIYFVQLLQLFRIMNTAPSIQNDDNIDLFKSPPTKIFKRRNLYIKLNKNL